MPLSAPTSYNNLTLDSRLKSFTKSKSKAWPHNSSYKATPDTLARAGFVFTPDTTRKSDRVTCFVCGKTLGGWEPEDDPFKEHAEHSPACSWGLARCSIEALRVSPESTDLVFPDEESLPSSATLEAARLATFGKFWPHDSVRSHSAKSKHMAKAGFIYTPTQESDDLASCFYCNLGLDGWESTDDPHHEHQRRRPQCAFFSARVSTADEPESQPKRGKVKPSKKPQYEDVDEDDDQPLLPPKPKKGASTIKRTGSKSSKAAPSDPDLIKQELTDDDPPPSRGKLRKSQSHGQLQSGRSTLGKSTTQPERPQSALGRSVVGRNQSRLGHRSGGIDDDDEDDEPPPVPAKPKPKAKKKAAPEPEPETEDPEPARPKTKTRSTKKPVGEVDEEAEPEPEPKAKPRTKGGKAKAKTAPEPEPEAEDEEEAPPPPPKAKTKTKAKTTTGKGKKGGKKVVEDPVESSTAEMEVESGMDIDSAAEPEPAPKKTRAKKTTTAAKKTTRGKKTKAKAGDDTESQAEPELEDVHMQSQSETELPATSTPRPPSRIASRVEENTPRAGAGPNANAKSGTGLPVPSRLTPSPSRLARPGPFGTPRGPSQPGSGPNTPRQVAVGSGISRLPSASGMAKSPSGAGIVRPPSASGIARPPSASGIARPPSASGIARPPSASGIARPSSTTGIPRPGTTTPGSAGTTRTGIPQRQPSPIRPGVARPVFGALNRNNSNTDVVMASPGPSLGTPSRPVAVSPGSPTRTVVRPLSQVQPDIGSTVPFPRESSPMTPGRPLNTTRPAASAAVPAPKAKPASNAPTIDMALAELDAETRALTLEAYVRREMKTQYDALKAECEKDIEDFLKAASETRAKITAL
ncbi:unnamed protein product [Rhizoctonia solani]|uniref:Protein bir1 n=1 Tax=Rhizoctonia solani TaxID=456999 RepID=A0A8H3GS13_9AGAM|nr:unnamed protein product [Rhizoctonia solani]